MARGQAQYLRLYSGGATFNRWQNYYVGAAATWSGANWDWLPFEVQGLSEGQSGDEGGLSVTLPATAAVMADVQLAVRDGWLAEVSVYEFDILLGNTSPQPGQVLVASALGEVVGAGGSFESIRLEIGSALSPLGAQVPPRTFTTRLIGPPCKL